MIKGRNLQEEAQGGGRAQVCLRVDRLIAEAATKHQQADTLSEDGDVKADNIDFVVGPVDKAAAMAARRAYVASATAADNEAAASAARHAHATMAARRMVEADVSAVRRVYAANPPPPTMKQWPPPQSA